MCFVLINKEMKGTLKDDKHYQPTLVGGEATQEGGVFSSICSSEMYNESNSEQTQQQSGSLFLFLLIEN